MDRMWYEQRNNDIEYIEYAKMVKTMMYIFDKKKEWNKIKTKNSKIKTQRKIYIFSAFFLV